jgi:hypothetical protein
MEVNSMITSGFSKVCCLCRYNLTSQCRVE